MLRSLLAFVAGLLPLQALYARLMQMAIRAMELDLLPDFVIRRGIRFLLSGREAEVRGRARRPDTCRAALFENPVPAGGAAAIRLARLTAIARLPRAPAPLAPRRLLPRRGNMPWRHLRCAPAAGGSVGAACPRASTALTADPTRSAPRARWRSA
jgi:hypothetical protein